MEKLCSLNNSCYFCTQMRKLVILLFLSIAVSLMAQTDSLRCPVAVVPQQMVRPYYYGLHQGLNVQLSASVMAGFGKYAPKGAGFAQNLQATYLAPLSNKLTIMAGGYVNNLTWGGITARNAGLYGELSYQFDDHWEAHVYGQKNITGTSTGFIPGLYGYGRYGYAGYGYGMAALMGLPAGNPLDGGYMGAVDRIGAGVRYMPNPTLSIEVNIEQMWLPNQPYMPYTGGDFHQHVSNFGQQHALPTQRP